MNGCNLAIVLSAIFCGVLGVVYFGIGIWSVADTTTNQWFANYIYFSKYQVQSFTFQVGFIIIPFGFLPLFPMILAIYSIVNDHRQSLIAFVIINIIFVLFEISMTIASGAMLSYEMDKLNTAMTTSLNNYIGIPFSYTQNNGDSLQWDIFMLRNLCCGIDGSTDFTVYSGTKASIWAASYRSYLLSNGNDSTMTLPAACCKMQSTGYYQLLVNNDWSNYRNYLIDQYCPVYASNAVIGQGCFTIIKSYLTSFVPGIIGSFWIVIFLQIVGISTGAFRYMYWDGYVSSDEINNNAKVQPVLYVTEPKQQFSYTKFSEPSQPVPSNNIKITRQGNEATGTGGQYGRSFGDGWGSDSYESAF